jgi:hypothetical protein
MAMYMTTKIHFTPIKDTRVDLKKCINCVNFKYSNYLKKDPTHADYHHNGQCVIFGHVDPVSGEETFLHAKVARGEKAYCTLDGIYYKQNINNIKPKEKTESDAYFTDELTDPDNPTQSWSL